MTSPMIRALELARGAAEAGEVPVGAVIVNPVTGEIIAEGANRPIAGHDPTAHAEIIAIRDAAERLTGLDLYVTLEPCAMCAGAISFARLRRLVFAAADEKGGAVLHGPRFFEQPTCHWRPEILQEFASAAEAGELLQQFFRSRRK
jgi:tRNA(adenine34) deaminase